MSPTLKLCENDCGSLTSSRLCLVCLADITTEQIERKNKRKLRIRMRRGYNNEQ